MDRIEAEVAAGFDALRADLLRGDFGALDVHLTKLSALGEEVAMGSHGSAALCRMRADAERNREILAAAAGGVRAALRRLGEAGAATSVYTLDGSRVPLAAQPPARGSRA